MTTFIRLHRKNKVAILVNVDFIVSIEDLRNDPNTNDIPEWHMTLIVTTFQRLEVLETEREILAKINHTIR